MSENRNRTNDRPLFILQYLIRNTDDDHKVSLTQLMDVCKASGHGGNRHTISNDIDILCRYGFDIICSKEGNKNTYSYGSRQLDTAELRMLMDAVCSSVVIPPQKSESLAKKIALLSGQHDAEKLCSTVYLCKKARIGNQHIFLTIDAINQAINEGKKVRFHTLTLTGNRECVMKHGGVLHSVSPYLTLWQSDRYYVIGWTDNCSAICSFRVDQMDIPQLTDEAAVPRPRDFNPEYYCQTLTTMCGDGSEMDVALLCDDTLMGSMMDRFGDGFSFERAGTHHFLAKVHVNASSAFWAWVFAFGGKMKVVGPDRAKEQYAARLHAALSA